MDILRDDDFARWLKNIYKTRKGTPLVAEAQRDYISRCRLIEMYEGDLDKNFLQDGLKRILSRLVCTDVHPRHDIPINGDPKNGTSTLKTAAKSYYSFCIYSKPKI